MKLCSLMKVAEPGPGSRIHLITTRESRRKMRMVRIIPYLLYATGIGFDVAAAVTVTNLTESRNPARCRIAMEICLVFFVILKSLVQLFLIERSRAIRARLKKRAEDAIWLVSSLICLTGTCALGIVAFISPLAERFPGSGECRIGLPRKATMILMFYDLSVNIGLTGVFLVLLRPALQLRTPERAQDNIRKMNSKASLPVWTITARSSLASLISLKLPAERTPDSQPQEDVQSTLPRMHVVDSSAEALQALIRRTIFGAIAMMMGTTANLAALYAMNREHGWVCFSCCMADSQYCLSLLDLLCRPYANTRQSHGA
nr:hypothetical protein CFP56_71079 [Quercus suber]